MSATNRIDNKNILDSANFIPDYCDFGYNVNQIENIDSRFKCIFCSLIIRDPIQSRECGHRCCQRCFREKAASSPEGNVICPVMDCDATTNINQTMIDKAFRRELDALSVTCVYKQHENCTWTGPLSNYESHLNNKHMSYVCRHCHENLSSKEAYDEHLSKNCPVLFRSCPFATLCTNETIHQDQYLAHLLSEKHQVVIQKMLLGDCSLPEPMITEQNDELDSNNHELYEQISMRLNKLSQDVQKLNDDSVQLNTDFIRLREHINAAAQELNYLHSIINENSSIKQNLQLNQVKLQKAIDELQQLCDENENISTDGTLTWRVTQFSEKLSAAQSDRVTSIYSPPFYSSPNGYKMQVRLFPFGDGNARRSHISLFFLLLKGEYDALLKWPFHYRITFCLLDQTGNNIHIVDSFHPDVKSNSFQRPKDTANIASGIPKFFSLTTLLQENSPYVQDDTLFIKIIVGFNETPKLILPYLLNLNPALPSHVQETLINKEINKGQQSANSQATSMNTDK